MEVGIAGRAVSTTSRLGGAPWRRGSRIAASRCAASGTEPRKVGGRSGGRRGLEMAAGNQ